MYFKAVFHAELERGKKMLFLCKSNTVLTDVAFHFDLIP